MQTDKNTLRTKQLQRIPRSQLRSVMILLYQKQGNVCAICGKPIDFSVTGHSANYAVDHCHRTGEIRGTLHKSCNSAEGKVANAAGRWGAKSTDYEDIIEFLDKLVIYLKKSRDKGTGLMYPDHKTPEQKAEADKLKRRKAYAAKKAAEAVAKRKSN